MLGSGNSALRDERVADGQRARQLLRPDVPRPECPAGHGCSAAEAAQTLPLLEPGYDVLDVRLRNLVRVRAGLLLLDISHVRVRAGRLREGTSNIKQ